MTDYEALLTGYPIYIATKEIQRRKHHKKRINKKWRKRYGMIELNSMPHGEVVMMDNGIIWMTKRTFESLKLSHRKGAISAVNVNITSIPIIQDVKNVVQKGAIKNE